MTQHRTGLAPSGAQRGFSIVEVLIAALILMFVALGTIPLFTMAMRSNLSGHESTKVANFARERLEEFWQLPFDDPLLTIVSGDERVHDDYFDEATSRWLTLSGTPPADSMWIRHVIIRQYAVDDLTAPISSDQAAVDPSRVQLKQITVSIDTSRTGGPLGGAKTIVLQAFKAQ